MASLTAARNTVRVGVDAVIRDFTDPVAAGQMIYAGAIVCLDASGNAVKGATATTLSARGIAQKSANNSNGAAGDIRVEVSRGAYWLSNSTAADAITRAEIGDNCYIVDDQTVAKTNGGSTRSVAGKILDIDANQGVLVEFA